MEKNGFVRRNVVRLRETLSLSTVSYLLVILLALGMVLVLPLSASAEERLVVEDAEENTTFSVADDGLVYTSKSYYSQGAFPGFWIDETGDGHKGAFFVLDNNQFQIQRRAQDFGKYEASVFLLDVRAPNLSLTVSPEGNVGFGTASYAFYPLEMKDGAYCDGFDWVSASSREYKQNIHDLTADEALVTLKDLNPVRFNYKKTPDEENLGFIAEDVPDLVATKDRKGMSSMDVVAVLTKVVQEQQKTIAKLSKKMDELERELKLKNDVAMVTTDLFRPVVK